MLLDDKVCIVSGVGPGLGQAIAKAMAREGARVVLAARSGDYLEAVADDIAAAGGEALAVPTNIADAEARTALIEATLERFGRLDSLVNCAFRPDPGDLFVDADLDRWRKVFDVNVWGTLGLTQAAVPALAADGGGSIVFVSSMVLRKPMPRQGAYASSKGALYVAARMLAAELAPLKIRVNSVVPGWMWGPNVQLHVDWLEHQGMSRDEAVAHIGRDIPQGAIPTSEACAEPVVFLASDAAAAITGQALDVNGGEVVH